ncbi:MAG TPA: zf-HC2 domain-containing protein [Tenuifilaceae bacterium]|nr:zf-HC2 domain-containing protein [Tenuifilaceae bacterium]
MDCRTINDQIIQYLDRELDETRTRQFEEHIATCAYCKKAVDAWVKLNGILEVEKSEYTDNPFLAQKIWHRINTKGKVEYPSTLAIRRIVISSLAAAGIFIGVLIGTLFNNSILTSSNDVNNQPWAMVSEEYFPTEIFTPFE